MRPSPQTLPVGLLILDVHRLARAQGEVSRTADRIANLFRCRVRSDINRRRGWREGSVPSRSTCDLDAHWRVDVQREPADEHIDEAQLCLDLRRPVRALGNGFNRAWRYQPVNPGGRERLLDDLTGRGQTCVNGGVVTGRRRDEEADDGEFQHTVHEHTSWASGEKREGSGFVGTTCCGYKCTPRYGVG